MPNQVFVLVIEKDEPVRKMLAERLPHYGCCAVTTDCSESAMRLLGLPPDKISFIGAVLIGDPFSFITGTPTIDPFLIAQRIKEVLPGRPIISFPGEKQNLKKEPWADFYLQKHNTDQLFQVLQQISQKGGN